MRKIISSFEESYFLIVKHWSIYFIVVLFTIPGLLHSVIRIPTLISLALALLHLGWFGAKFELLLAAVKKESLPWGHLSNLFWEYIKKLLPMAALFFLVSAIFLGFLLFSYGKWYFGGRSLPQDRTEEIKQIQGMIISLRNVEMLNEFSAQSRFAYIDIFLRFVPGLSFVLENTLLTIMVTNNLGIFRALRKSFNFIKTNLAFSCCIFILYFALTAMNGLTLMLFGDTFPEASRVLFFLTGIPFHFVELVLTTSVLIFYVKRRSRV